MTGMFYGVALSEIQVPELDGFRAVRIDEQTTCPNCEGDLLWGEAAVITPTGIVCASHFGNVR